ncbi:MAG TPA: BatD family protein [Longimicrobiales bacterium]|nr:BatD family protein [Longimicrobiales bacterium]
MLLALLCASLMCAQDPVRVTASLSAGRINVGSTTTLQVTVETRGPAPQEIRLPTLSRDLEILGTSDYTQQQITIPGGRTRATRRDVVIVARSPGLYRIPSVIVRVAGVTYRTDPLDLIVTSGGAAGTGGLESSSSLNVTLNADTVYVGEQILLRAEATFAEEMRTRQSRPATFDPPAPTGFWIQDLPDPISVTLRSREGRTVETQTYRRAYFPLSPGAYRFPPARLHYEIRRGFLYAPETRELVSDSAPIVVLPVPAEGRPPSYTGAVGTLSLQASVAPAQIRAGDPTVLTVELTGTGNVKALPEPRLPELPGVEIFPPNQESRVDVDQDRVGGMKRFRWMLVPQEAGSLVIPPIEYGVFDPEREVYIVLRSDTLRVTVTQTAIAAPTDTALRPLRTRPGGTPLGWVRTPAFAAIQIVPLLLLVSAIGMRRRRERPAGPRDIARDLIQRLEDLRTDPASPALLAELEWIARDAVARVAGIAGDPVVALRQHKRPAAATELETLLRELNRLRFAPAEPYDAGRLIDRVRAFVAMLEPRRGWHGRRVMLVTLLVLPAAAMAVQDEPRDAFTSGVQHYELGEFVEAANAFHDYARAAPHDASGWYDLGLAAYRAGDPGRAAWAWLRTVELAPRDADARHNLRAIDAAGALARVQPLDWLNDSERALIASAAWWLLLLPLAFMTVRARVRRGPLVPAATIIILVAVAAAVDATRPTVVTPLGQGTRLYAAPTTRDEALGDMPAGTVARLVEQRSGWLRVRTAEGTDAWVERNAVAAP